MEYYTIKTDIIRDTKPNCIDPVLIELRIRQLNPTPEGKTPPPKKECTEYDTIQRNEENPFIAITPMSTLTQNGSTY